METIFITKIIVLFIKMVLGLSGLGIIIVIWFGSK